MGWESGDAKYVAHTFYVGWEVDFNDFAVEGKNGLEVGLDDVACKIGDDDDLGIWLFVGLSFHVNVDIARLWGS